MFRKIILSITAAVLSIAAQAQDIWTLPANFNNMGGGQYYTSTALCEGGAPGVIVYWVDGVYPRSRCSPMPGLTVVEGVPNFAATSGAADWATMLNKPTLGTAAALSIAASGDASAAQVVMGNDSRLTNARTPSAHTHSASQINDATGAGRAILTAADASAIRSLLTVQSTTEAQAMFYPVASNPAGFLTSAALSPYLTTAAATATYYPKPAGSTAQYLDGTGALRTFPVVAVRSKTSVTKSLGVCFQLSTTRDAWVTYNVEIASASNLVGGQRGTLFLETFTDSGCTTGTEEIMRSTSGNTMGVGVSIGNTVYQTLNVNGWVFAGLWAKLRTVNDVSTPTFTARPGQEVLQ